MNYKHTQYSYLMMIITLIVLLFFIYLYFTARAEIPSYDSWTNLIVNTVMLIIIFIHSSFCCLTVKIDNSYLKIKFGFGIFSKKFKLSEIKSVEIVKNHWYYWWWIRVWFWPYMWIYNVSGFDAIEIVFIDNKRIRIGSDEVDKLSKAIKSNTI